MLFNIEFITGINLGFEYIEDEYFSYLLIDLFFVRLQFSLEKQ
jgi:hypothetical protein